MVVVAVPQLHQDQSLQAVFTEFLERVLQSPNIVEINIAAALALEALSLMQ